MAQEAEMENMRLILNQAREKLGPLKDSLLTKADLLDLDVDLTKDMISLSWKKKRRELIPKSREQDQDSCWAVAYSEGIHAKYVLHARKNPSPTPSELLWRIHKNYLNEKKALIKPEYAMELLKEEYGINMKIYRRPSFDSTDQTHQEFELLIERLLAKSPVSVCFAYVPGYAKYEHTKDLFRPNETDKVALRYQKLDGHCVTLYAHGAFFKGDTCIQFWEGQDDYWPGKFVRFERHQHLVTEVYDFELDEVDQRQQKRRRRT